MVMWILWCATHPHSQNRDDARVRACSAPCVGVSVAYVSHPGLPSGVWSMSLMCSQVWVQVFPKGAQLKCTFTSWAPVCQYILNQMVVDPTSEWRKNGICIPTA